MHFIVDLLNFKEKLFNNRKTNIVTLKKRKNILYIHIKLGCEYWFGNASFDSLPFVSNYQKAIIDHTIAGPYGLRINKY